MVVIPDIDLAQFLLVHDHLHHHTTDGEQTRYLWGAKAPALDCDTSVIQEIDCSGYSRYILAKATNQQLVIPEGSLNQFDWFKLQGLQDVPYSQKGFSDQYEGLVICYMEQDGLRHVWFVHEGETYESSPAVGGVGSRIWSAGILRRHVTACWLLPTK